MSRQKQVGSQGLPNGTLTRNTLLWCSVLVAGCLLASKWSAGCSFGLGQKFPPAFFLQRKMALKLKEIDMAKISVFINVLGFD